MIVVALAVAIAAAWLAAIGFARLRTPLDRLHCVTFAAAACGVPIGIAATIADGLSDRTWKTWLLLAVVMASGAMLTHAIGRAIAYRDVAGEQE